MRPGVDIDAEPVLDGRDTFPSLPDDVRGVVLVHVDDGSILAFEFDLDPPACDRTDLALDFLPCEARDARLSFVRFAVGTVTTFRLNPYSRRRGS